MQKLIAVATTIAMFAAVAPAFADMNSSSIFITTSNNGSITNTTSSSAKTGDNDANGGKGGSGGTGGSVGVSGPGNNNNGGAMAGNGGTGGQGGDGGTIVTGDAKADAGTLNSLNSNDVAVGPNGTMNSSSVVLVLDNGNKNCECNHISNTTRAKARTGDNDANGGKGGKAGSGGSVTVGSGDNNNGGAHSGTGGNGGWGGWGGDIHTGAATSNAGTINVLNTNIIRVNH